MRKHLSKTSFKSKSAGLIAAFSCFLFAGSLHATTYTITAQGMTFTPNSQNCHVGDTIKFQWVNGTHTTTSTSVPAGAATWSQNLNSGSQTYKYVITKVGTYNYRCNFHYTMGMTGVLNATAAPLSATIAPFANISCTGGNNGNATASPAGGTSPYTYAWNPGGQTTATISSLTAGTYSVTVTDAAAATATASVTITQPASLPAITIASHTDVDCNGNPTGSAIANAATGGTSPYTYAWTPGGGNSLTASNLSANTYTITVTDNHGCTATASVIISQPASALGISIASHSNVNCNGNSTGNATANIATGGTTPYTYAWTPSGGSNLIASNLSAGIYTITVTDNHGCGATASANITQPITLGISIPSQTNVDCNGNSTGSASANAATGGTSPYTYAWTPSGGTSLTASNLTSGTYTITVTDNNSCTASASVNITQPASTLGITMATHTDVNCNGGTGSATANTATGGTSPYTYAWTPSGGNALTAVNVTAGTYTITVTDNHGCNASTAVNITQPPAISITIASQININCNGNSTGSATANAATGGSPTFPIISTVAGNGTSGYNGDGIAATSAELNGPAGVFVDGSGNIFIADISNNRIRRVDHSTGLITTVAGSVTYGYNGDGIAATSATLYYPASVSLDDSSNIFIGDHFNNRIRKVDHSTGLISTIAGNGIIGFSGDAGPATSSELNYPIGVSIDASSNIFVADYFNNRIRRVDHFTGVISTIAGNGTQGYNGDGIAATSAEFYDPGDIYVDNSDNIFIADQANDRIREVNHSTGLISTVAGNGAGGYNGDGITATTATIETPTGVFVDGTGNIFIVDDNNQRIREVNTSGIISTVAGNGTNGYNGDLIAATSAELSNPYGVYVDGSGNIFIADGGNNRIRKVSQVPAYTYLWTPSGGTNLATSNLNAGTYTITATDSHGCTATASVTITQPNPLSEITATTANALCYNNNNGSGDITASGGTLPYTYSWSNGNTTSSISGLSGGTYTVTLQDNCGVAIIDSVIITQPATLSAGAVTNTNVTCNGLSNGSANASSNGGTLPYTYSWSNGSSTVSTSSSPSALSAGSYTLTLMDNCGGSSITSVTITEPAAIAITTTVTPVTCAGGGSATASVSGGTSPYTYLWSDANSQTTVTAVGLASGSYTVTLTDFNGCTDTSSVFISITSGISVSANATANVSCFGGNNGSAMANVTGGTTPYTYLWSDGNSQTTANATGLSMGSYTVNVTDNNGCTGVATIGISQPNQLNVVAAAITNVSCNGGNNGSAFSVPSGGTAPYTYLWSPVGASSATVASLTVGTYTIMVMDSCGNSATASTVITQPNQLNIITNVISNVTCSGFGNGNASSVVNGGTTPYTYSWSDGEITANANGLGAGTYTLTVSDSCGGSATSTGLITQPAVLTTIHDSVDDNGSCNGIAVLIGSGGTSPYTYFWITGNQTTDSITGQCAGTYCCVITDNNHCVFTDCVTVNLATGMNEVKGESEKLKVYPNPSNGLFTFEANREELNIENIQVFNVLGQNAYSQFNIQNPTFNIDLSSQPSGVYFYRVTNSDGSLVGEGKIIIQK